MKAKILLSLMLASGISMAQTFTINEVWDDLNFLKDKIRTYNPGLSTYAPNFDLKSDSIIETINADLSLFDYYTKMSQLCALANEGHFEIGNWNDTIHRGFLANRYRYFPVAVRIFDNEILVWKDYSDEDAIPQGSKVIAINGHTSADIISKILNCVPYDGKIPTYPRRYLEKNFNWLYYFYVERPEQYEIKITAPDSDSIYSVVISALTRDKMFSNVHARGGNSDNTEPSINDVYEFEVEDGHAMLKLKTFSRGAMDEHKIKPGKLYDEIFNTLDEKNTQVLIVDLRDNAGGRKEFVMDILPFILSAPREGYSQKTISWEGKEKTYKLPKPSKTPFKGKIYVFVNGNTFSNGSVLARYLREYAGAVIIGEETGSRYEGFVAGSQEAVTLPNSGIVVGIPRYKIIFEESDLQTTTNRGLIPDHLVEYSLQDLIEGTDKHREMLDVLLNEQRD